MSHISAVLSFGIKSGKQEETFFFLVQDQIYLNHTNLKPHKMIMMILGLKTTETLTYFHGKRKDRILKRCGFYSP